MNRCIKEIARALLPINKLYLSCQQKLITVKKNDKTRRKLATFLY